MKIKTPTGTILESSNELVIEQWKKSGYKEVSQSGRKPKGTGEEPEHHEEASEEPEQPKE